MLNANTSHTSVGDTEHLCNVVNNDRPAEIIKLVIGIEQDDAGFGSYLLRFQACQCLKVEY